MILSHLPLPGFPPRTSRNRTLVVEPPRKKQTPFRWEYDRPGVRNDRGALTAHLHSRLRFARR